jgi:hypothetical protein
MPTKYNISTISGDHIYVESNRVLIANIIKQKSYKMIDWKLKKMLEQTSGTNSYGVNRKTQRRSSNLEILFCGFPWEKIHIWASLRKNGLVHLLLIQ